MTTAAAGVLLRRDKRNNVPGQRARRASANSETEKWDMWRGLSACRKAAAGVQGQGLGPGGLAPNAAGRFPV